MRKVAVLLVLAVCLVGVLFLLSGTGGDDQRSHHAAAGGDDAGSLGSGNGTESGIRAESGIRTESGIRVEAGDRFEQGARVDLGARAETVDRWNALIEEKERDRAGFKFRGTLVGAALAVEVEI